MNRRIFEAFLLVTLGLAFQLHAQNAVSNQSLPAHPGPERDPVALAILSGALNAAGSAVWANVNNYQISATATQWDFAPQSWPVVIAGQVSGAYRFEVDGMGVGALVEVANGATAQYTIGGSKPQVSPAFVPASRPIYFPLPYLAQVISDPNISLVSKGKKSISGRTMLQVDVRVVSPRAAGQSVKHLDYFTRRSLFFDAGSGVLVRISDYFYSPRNATSTLPRTMIYADYRPDQGLTFPHLVHEQLGSRDFAVITVQSILLNPGLSASSFSLQQ